MKKLFALIVVTLFCTAVLAGCMFPHPDAMNGMGSNNAGNSGEEWQQVSNNTGGSGGSSSNSSGGSGNTSGGGSSSSGGGSGSSNTQSSNGGDTSGGDSNDDANTEEGWAGGGGKKDCAPAADALVSKFVESSYGSGAGWEYASGLNPVGENYEVDVIVTDGSVRYGHTLLFGRCVEDKYCVIKSGDDQPTWIDEGTSTQASCKSEAHALVDARVAGMHDDAWWELVSEYQDGKTYVMKVIVSYIWQQNEVNLLQNNTEYTFYINDLISGECEIVRGEEGKSEDILYAKLDFGEIPE